MLTNTWPVMPANGSLLVGLITWHHSFTGASIVHKVFPLSCGGGAPLTHVVLYGRELQRLASSVQRIVLVLPQKLDGKLTYRVSWLARAAVSFSGVGVPSARIAAASSRKLPPVTEASPCHPPCPGVARHAQVDPAWQYVKPLEASM